jgi:hypothetical protein
MTRKYLGIATLAVMFVTPSVRAGFETPVLRMKFGYSATNLSAGDELAKEPLGSLLTLQPTVLFDFPSINSRIGVHYLGELLSDFGTIPISGVGFSAYFYPLGISSAHEVKADEVMFQKTRTGPYLMGALTPVNVSVNKPDPTNPAKNIFFSAFILETQFAVGFDYPLRQNLVLHGEVGYRFGAATADELRGQAVGYNSLSFMLGFMTAYY